MSIKEYEQEIMILGFKEVQIHNVNDLLNQIKKNIPRTQVQLFDADYVAGRTHLFFAALNALKAFKQKQNISESLGVESLLYASGQRQISKAIEMLGIRPTTSKIAALIFLSRQDKAEEVEETVSKIISGIRFESVLAVNKKKIQKMSKTFGITNLEFETMTRCKEEAGEALTKIVVERCAILSARI